jgi:hypothetical protein
MFNVPRAWWVRQLARPARTVRVTDKLSEYVGTRGSSSPRLGAYVHASCKKQERAAGGLDRSRLDVDVRSTYVHGMVTIDRHMHGVCLDLFVHAMLYVLLLASIGTVGGSACSRSSSLATAPSRLPVYAGSRGRCVRVAWYVPPYMARRTVPSLRTNAPETPLDLYLS